MQQRVLQSAGVTVRENEAVAVNLIVSLGIVRGRSKAALYPLGVQRILLDELGEEDVGHGGHACEMRRAN